MAFYSTSQMVDILNKLSKEPLTDAKYIKFERLGVEVSRAEEEEDQTTHRNDKDEGQLYACSVCKKRLISSHLLDLHVSENHDTYFELQKNKKPMVILIQPQLLPQ